MTLSREHIFECAFDDDMFSNLPHLITREFSARSMIFHLLTKDGQHSVAADSGYWPKMQLESYSRQFVDKDILLKVRLKPENINKICNVTEDLISRDELFNSEIYNDHYRVFGDDLTHAIGGCFETKRGRVAIGVHRGAGTNSFSADEVRRLSNLSIELTHMLMTRAEFAYVQKNANTLSHIIEQSNIAFIHIDEKFRIINFNKMGEEVILKRNGITYSNGRLITTNRAGLLLIDGISKAMFNRQSKIININNFGENSVEFKALPIFSKFGTVQMLVICENVLKTDDEIIKLLENKFCLTNIEAKVAVLVADGKTIEEIAQIRNVSPNTIKSQRKAVYTKTKCAKLSKLTMLISELKK